MIFNDNDQILNEIFKVLVVCFSTKVGKHPTEVDNIHNILATAAVQFNSNQLEHLFVLIQQVHFAWLL